MTTKRQQHGHRNVEGWQRLSVRQRAALARKMLSDEVQELRGLVDTLMRHHNQAVLRQEALLALVLESAHAHPETRHGIILLDRGASKPVPLTEARFLELLKAKTEELLQRETKPTDGETDAPVAPANEIIAASRQMEADHGKASRRGEPQAILVSREVADAAAASETERLAAETAAGPA